MSCKLALTLQKDNSSAPHSEEDCSTLAPAASACILNWPLSNCFWLSLDKQTSLSQLKPKFGE